VQPELIADCVHCGFCLPSCPTYTLWHEEMDSPRGRIHLMGSLVDGTMELTDTVVEHFDRCLGCMACVPACPSGVQYDRLIETTRAYIEENRRRTLGERLLRRLIFEVFPHRRRLRAALAFRRLPAPGPFAPLGAVAPPWLSSKWPPVHLPGKGPRVALVAGCVQSVVFGDVNAATARVLAADGYDVHVPKAQSCCGALHAHAGRLEEGVARAHTLADDLSGYDAIVTNAAGCGSHLKDHDIPNVVDVSELLVDPPATGAENMARDRELLDQLVGGERPARPLEWKLELARRITARWHGEEGARAGEEHFTRVVRRHEAPAEVPDATFEAGGGPVYLPTVLQSAFGRSASHWRRQIDQGGVKVNGDPPAGYELEAGALDGALVQAGKRQFVRLHLA